MSRARFVVFIAILLLFTGLSFAQSTAVKPPMIILMGPPLSGKTEQAQMINNTYGLPVISIEGLVQDNQKELARLQHPGASLSDMRYDPAMTRFFKAQLESLDRSHGVVLDGYPATQYQAEDLKNLLQSTISMLPLVLQLEIPDEVVQKRIAASGAGAKANQEMQQRLKDYHREFDAVAYFFPKATIVKIDGTKPIATVSSDIQAALAQVPVARRGK